MGKPREELVVRFAVGSKDGPRSAVWRLWTQKGKSDVYVAARPHGGDVKVSLHESGDWRFAYTDVYWERRASSGVENRVIERWNRPAPTINGITPAFTVIVPSGEIGLPRHPLTEQAKKYARNVTWAQPAPEGFETHFTVVYTDPGGPELDEHARFRLPNGQSISLMVQEHAISEEQNQQLGAARLAMAEAVRQGSEEERAALEAWLEPRTWLFGRIKENGARFFIDLSGGYLFEE